MSTKLYPGESMRDRVRNNFVTLGQQFIDHADEYADRITTMPLLDYSIIFHDICDGETIPTLSIETMYVNKDIL